MTKEEVILVPLTREEIERIWMETDVIDDDKINSLMEGKEGLNREEIDLLHTLGSTGLSYYEERGIDADKEETDVLDKLKRWIE